MNVDFKFVGCVINGGVRLVSPQSSPHVARVRRAGYSIVLAMESMIKAKKRRNMK